MKNNPKTNRKESVKLKVGFFLSSMGFLSIFVQIIFGIILYQSIEPNHKYAFKSSKLWYILFDNSKLDLKFLFIPSILIFLFGIYILLSCVFVKDNNKL